MSMSTTYGRGGYTIVGFELGRSHEVGNRLTTTKEWSGTTTERRTVPGLHPNINGPEG